MGPDLAFKEIAVAVNDNLGPWTLNMAPTFGPCEGSKTVDAHVAPRVFGCGVLASGSSCPSAVPASPRYEEEVHCTFGA